MPVQVERVLPRVLVVEHDLDDLIVLKYVAVSVYAVDFGVGGQLAGCEGRVEGGDFWAHVGDAAEEGVVLATSVEILS